MPKRDLRYGENPHQKAAWIHGRSGLSAPWTMHQGKELSYTNLLDLDAALRIALEFTEPAAVVIKHTNPCGVATGASAADAYVRARDADPLSAFGGIVGLNRPLDAERRGRSRRRSSRRSSRPSVADDARDDPGGEAEHARGDRELRCVADAAERRRLRPRRRSAQLSGRRAHAGARSGDGSREAWPHLRA